jgi:hypothetical protein
VNLRSLSLLLLLALGPVAAGQDGDARGLTGALRGERAGTGRTWAARLVQPRKGVGGNSRASASKHRAALADAASALARAPEQATQADLDALIARSKEGRSLFYAAPELHDALSAIAAKGDPALRTAAEEAAKEIELDAHMVDLRRAAFAARDEGKRGVEIWSEITRRSVEFWKDREGVSEEQKYDEVMADVSSVFNGPAAIQHLTTYQRTFGRLPRSDQNVPHMLEVLKRRRGGLGYVGGGIDPTQSEDFRPAFNDGSNNQVFHTNFFVLLGHAAGKNDPKIVNLVNLKHELLDGGRSVPDWTASEAGAEIGRTIRLLRDTGKGRKGLLALPTIIGSSFSNQPGDYARPYGPEGPDYTSLSQVLGETMSEFEQAPRTGYASQIQRGLIRLFGGKR